MVARNPSTHRLSDEEWERLEQVVERFEAAWQSGPPPAIEDFVKGSTVEAHSLVAELAHTDLECRLKAGEAARVEAYFERFPGLAADRDSALGLIAAEYRLRRRREPDLGPGEFFGRFPQFRDELTRRLPAAPPAEHPTPTPPRCPACRQPVSLDKWVAGSEATCPECGQTFRVAEEPSSAQPAGGPSRLGPYKLLAAVGQGAFGTVYRAHDTELDRVVAVKVPRGAWLTPAEAERFVREARSAAQLAHPGIVPVYGVGHADSRPFLVSAFVRGRTLAEEMAGRAFDFREAADLAARIAEALDHAHRQGVIHRDLKPSNVMLGRLERSTRGGPEADGGESPQPFVMDFGLARRDEGEITVTGAGQVLGTPAYMSPEQARGDSHHVDGRTDQYSLGVMLYELLTGELPFRGVARMVLQQILTEEPRPPRRLNDKIPRDLETITLKCLAKEPARRYATAADLAADLRHFLAGEPIVARPVGRLERAARWARRNPRVATLSGLVALLLLTVVVGSVVSAVLLDRRRVAAAQARTRAEQSEAVALQRLDLTLDTFDTLVFEVQDQLRDKPTLHQLKEDLLKKALAGLEKVAAADPARGDYAATAARYQLGDVYLALGRTSDARRLYEEAVGLGRGLAAADPGDLKARRNLMVALGKLGTIQTLQGDLTLARDLRMQALILARELAAAPGAGQKARRDLVFTLNEVGKAHDLLNGHAEAEKHWREALEVARAMEQADPQGPIPKIQTAETLECLGNLEFTRKKMLTALDYYRQDLGYRQAVASANPEDFGAKFELARAYQLVGHAHGFAGQHAEALSAFQLAVGLEEALANADPANTRFRRNLALTYEQAGGEHRFQENIPEALTCYRKCLTHREAWAAADPANAQAQIELATVHGNLGILYLQTYAFDEAAERFGQGIAVLQPLAAAGKLKQQAMVDAMLRSMQAHLENAKAAHRAIEDPDFALERAAQGQTVLAYYRVTFLVRQDRYEEAAAMAERLRRTAPQRAKTVYDVACCYGVCVARLEEKKDRLTPEERSQKERYTACAIEALAEAARLGFGQPDKLLTDPDLKALRQEEGFLRLIERLRAQSADKPPGKK